MYITNLSHMLMNQTESDVNFNIFSVKFVHPQLSNTQHLKLKT